MSNYDMLIITGLPRAGTTFLNNLFANGILGDRYYGHHSRSLGGLGNNPLHLCESRVIGSMFRNGIRVDEMLPVMCRYWRDQSKQYDSVIVYKHPQITLQLPLITDRGWQVKYLICNRDFESWRLSFMRMNGHGGIQPYSTDSHYQKYWRGDWSKPEDIEARIRMLYDLFQYSMAQAQNAHVFNYSNNSSSLKEEIKKLIVMYIDFAERIDIEYRANYIINRYWREPIL